MTRITKEERAEYILDIARLHSGCELRLMELAEHCGRTPGQGFSRDLALARHMALDAGERITECYWSPDRQETVLVHLYAGAEDGKGIRGIVRHSNDVKTRVHTLRRHAAWEANNATTPIDRKIAEVNEKMAAGAEYYGEALAELNDLLRMVKDGGKQ